MRLSSTSSQRTYRYVRLGIVGAAGVIAVALGVVWVSEGPVTSLSALFYTSGRTAFTGALCAIALALVALSGHSIEQHLLDVAAPLAVLIAVVPTPLRAGDAPGACVGGCDPLLQLPGVHTGVITLAIAGVAGIVLAMVLVRVQRLPAAGPAATAVAVGVIVVGAVVWLAVAPDAMLAAGHVAATGLFFGVITAVCIVSAMDAAGFWRRLYTAVAVSMGVVLGGFGVIVLALAAGALPHGSPAVLVAEGLLVAAFAVFWVAQTVQKWGEADPTLSAGIP